MSEAPKNVFLEQYEHDVHFSKTMLRVIIILMKRMGVQEIGLKPEEFLYLHDNAGISIDEQFDFETGQQLIRVAHTEPTERTR